MAKIPKKKSPYNKESAIRGALRRTFSRSPLVREVLEESRQEFPRYKKDGTRHKKNWVKRQCQVCNEWVPSSDIAVDHIDPVISIQHGKQSWSEYIDRLWCETSGKANLQRLCSLCHADKSHRETIARLIIKYNGELNKIEANIVDLDNAQCDMTTRIQYHKDWRKLLSKYTSKKKTIGLEKIVERALELKKRLNLK